MQKAMERLGEIPSKRLEEFREVQLHNSEKGVLERFRREPGIPYKPS